MKKINSHSRSHTTFKMMTLTQFAQATPPEIFDARCEFDVPRLINLKTELENDGCQLEQDDPQEEEFFRWFQIAHDFKVKKKVVASKKDTLQRMLPPKQPSRTNILKLKAAKQSPHDDVQTKQEKKVNTQTSTGQNPCNSYQRRQSRKVLQRTQSSQMMSNGASKIKSQQKSFDANASSKTNFFVKQNASNNKSNTKQTIDNIIIDLGKVQSNNSHTSRRVSNVKTGAKTYREVSGTKCQSQARTDFISRNKERINQISARSKQRKTSSGKQPYQQQQLEDVISSSSTSQVAIEAKMQPQHIKKHSFKASWMNGQGHLTNLSLQNKGVGAVPSNMKNLIIDGLSHSSHSNVRKRNQRVNSQIWSQTMSTNNLLKAQSIPQTDRQRHHDTNTSSSKDQCSTNQKPLPEKENLLQSQYLKQLMKMQQKYHNVPRTHHRNNTQLNGSTTQLSGSTSLRSFLINDKKAKNNPSQERLRRHTQTNSYSKQCSDKAQTMLDGAASLKNSTCSFSRAKATSTRKGREPFFSTICLNNI